MKILCLTHRVPFPPDRGDRIRSYHILKFLAERADVDLACLADEPIRTSTRQELDRHCQRVAIASVSSGGRWIRALRSIACGRSASEGLFDSERLRQTIDAWTAKTSYDAVFVYCSSMGQYLAAGRLQNIPCVVDFIDVDSEKWSNYAGRASGPKRWLYQLESRRVEKLEQELGRRAKAVLVVSNSEAEIARHVCPGANVRAIINGVDLAYFDTSPVDATSVHTQRATGDRDCTFIGALDYFPNVDGVLWFAHEVWPQIHGRHPQSAFNIVGRRPIQQIRRLTNVPGINVIADVPDVRPFLMRARAVVVPLRLAPGIQNKVLEALAAGKPVVASTKALEGLDIVPGEHALEATTPEQWMRCLESLFADDRRCNQLGKAGRDFVCQHHRWDNCLRPLESLLGLARPTKQNSLCAVGPATIS